MKERRELITPTNNNSSEPSTSRYNRDEETGDVVSEQKNFIDQMILRDGEFSDDEIHDHIYTFIAAGYETIALQTSYTLLLLAIYSDAQEKVFLEIVENFPNKDSKLDKDSIEKLRYLDTVLKESLRLLPAVPLVGRKTLDEFELNGLVVPSGVTFIINFYSLHRKKEFWGADADQFNPERFSKEQESQREPNIFLPFSSGPRNCIGKHYATSAMKIFLIKFLKNYKVSTDLKYEELRLKADITLKVCNDIILKVVKR